MPPARSPATRVRLIHWKPEEARAEVDALQRAGYEVDAAPLTPASLRTLRERPPDVVLIDLSRLPMQGRDAALVWRQSRATRGIPVVFVGGEPDKVARVRACLPDATYTSWPRARSAIRAAMAHPPANPMAPESRLAGYSGTPLPRKLGIKAGTKVALVNAPRNFEAVLGELPADVVVTRRAAAKRDMTLLFVTTDVELALRLPTVSPAHPDERLWICWPKKVGSAPVRITQATVRAQGLAAGLVDYKICAIDPTWSGLLFSRRKAAASKSG